MSEDTDHSHTLDPALSVFVALLRFHGIGADAAQLHHRFGVSKFGIQEMLRGAKEFGLRARACRTSWKRLALTPLPAIAALRDGSFMLLGKVSADEAIDSVTDGAATAPDEARRIRGAVGRSARVDDAARGVA